MDIYEDWAPTATSASTTGRTTITADCAVILQGTGHMQVDHTGSLPCSARHAGGTTRAAEVRGLKHLTVRGTSHHASGASTTAATVTSTWGKSQEILSNQ